MYILAFVHLIAATMLTSDVIFIIPFLIFIVPGTLDIYAVQLTRPT